MHDTRLRILIVRLSHLGDVVHALPLLPALRAAHPHARIAWAVQPEYAELLRGRAELDEIVTFDRRGGVGAWARLQEELVRFGADWSIDAQGNVKSAIVALASRAPRRSGFARADWTESFAAGSLTDAADPAVRGADGAMHAMERTAALIRHVAPGRVPAKIGDTSADSLRAREHSHAQRNTRRDLLSDARSDARSEAVSAAVSDTRSDACFEAWFGAAHGPFAVLHLADERDVRAWPAARFADLARDLAADHDVLVMAGPGERAEGLEAARSLTGVERVICVPDQAGLRALDEFLHAAALREAVFVGCDSGPMHLAWSAGCRVVLLAGPQDERCTGPWPVPAGSSSRAMHRVVRSGEALACAPCRKRACHHRAGNVCMSGLDPARVATAVRSLTADRPHAR